MYFFCNIHKLGTPLSQIGIILLFIFNSKMLILSFNISKIHCIIDIIGQILAPNRRFIEELKKVLTFSMCQLLIIFSKDYVNFVSVA